MAGEKEQNGKIEEVINPEEIRVALWSSDTLDKQLAGDQDRLIQNETQAATPEVTQHREAERSKSGAPSIKLSMNLNIDLQLKAKIKGRLELSVLGGNKKQ